MKLWSAMKSVADEDAKSGASAEVRARLLAEVRSIARARQRRAVLVLAAALVVGLAAGVEMWRITCCTDIPASRTTAAVTPVERTEVATEFFPLISGVSTSTPMHIVRIEVPRQALASFGLITRELDHSSSGSVLADVMVGDDGLARAVRFVRPVSEQEKRP